MRPFFGVVICLCWTFQLNAQVDRFWLDARYGDGPSATASSLWLAGGAEAWSNTLRNHTMTTALAGSSLDASSTAYLAALPSNSNSRVSVGGDVEAWLRLAGKNLRFRGQKRWSTHFGFGYSDRMHGKIRTGALQLMVNGNSPFEGETLSLGPGKLTYLSYQFIGIGVDRSSDKFLIGGSLQLIKLSRFARLLMGEGSLYTAPYGEYLEATARIDYASAGLDQPKGTGWYGTGVGVNFFLTTLAGERKPSFTFQCKDIGIIYVGNAAQRELTIDTTFRGLAFSIQSPSDRLGTSWPSSDSLDNFGQVEAFSSALNLALPGRLQADFILPIGEKFSLNTQAGMWLNDVLAWGRIGFTAHLTSWLAIEPSLRIGGYSRVDWSIPIALNINKKALFCLDYQQLENDFFAERTTSRGVRASLHWRW
jgi:hypothetical protein